LGGKKRKRGSEAGLFFSFGRKKENASLRMRLSDRHKRPRAMAETTRSDANLIDQGMFRIQHTAVSMSTLTLSADSARWVPLLARRLAYHFDARYPAVRLALTAMSPRFMQNMNTASQTEQKPPATAIAMIVAIELSIKPSFPSASFPSNGT
jgi:hypothetical protein